MTFFSIVTLSPLSSLFTQNLMREISKMPKRIVLRNGILVCLRFILLYLLFLWKYKKGSVCWEKKKLLIVWHLNYIIPIVCMF